jgi:hypothetical protein
MTLTNAILLVYRKNKTAALGNMAVLYAEVCQVLEVPDATKGPNPGSVYRIGRRFRQYGLDCWSERSKHV